MIIDNITGAVVDDGVVTIALHGTVTNFPSNAAPEDFYVQLQPRYKLVDAVRYHFTIAVSQDFDIASRTPNTLRKYLYNTFQELLDHPAVVRKYGRLVPKGSVGQLRCRLYDSVAKRFETGN